jgi:hypothetical protein
MSTVPRSVCNLVDARDHYCCVRCGKSLHVTAGSRHHRQRRAVGLHRPANLILLCGSGTTGCHGWVHEHPEAARAAGWIVRANGLVEAEETPLLVKPVGWVMLDSQGNATCITDMLARALIGPNL